MGINLMTGQQTFPFGAEQALRRPQNCYNEAGVVPCGHRFGSLRARNAFRLDATTIPKSEANSCGIHHIAALSPEKYVPTKTMLPQVSFWCWRQHQGRSQVDRLCDRLGESLTGVLPFRFPHCRGRVTLVGNLTNKTPGL